MARKPSTTDRYLTQEVLDIPDHPDKRGTAILDEPLNLQRWGFRLINALLHKHQEQHGPINDDERAARLEQFAGVLAEITLKADPENTTEVERITQELAKASHAVRHGSSKGAEVDGKINRDGPNPNSPQRRLLWAYALKLELADFQSPETHEGMENLSGKSKEEKLGTLERELAESRSMRQMKSRFSARASSRGGFSENPIVRFGEAGSWFYSANKKSNPQLRRNIINLDILQSLVLGDFVDAVFQHELEHDEKSLHYPPFLQELIEKEKDAQTRIEEAQQKITAIRLDKDLDAQLEQPALKEFFSAQQDYLRASYQRELVHGIWNAAEDNMCNQGAANLSHAKSQPYLFDLAYSINLCTAIVAGCGDFIRDNRAIPEEPSAQPQDILSEIGHAINMAFFVRNGICENTPEDIKTIGVDTRVLATSNKPDGDARFNELYALCERIAHAQPHPDKRIYKNYAKLCEETCTERNGYIQELYERFVEQTVDKCMEQFEEVTPEQQLKMLKDAIQQRKEAARGGAPAQEGEGSPGRGGKQHKGKSSGIPIIDPETGEELGEIDPEETSEKGQAGQQNMQDAETVEAQGIEAGEKMEDLKAQAASDEGDPDLESDKRESGEQENDLTDQAPKQATAAPSQANQGGASDDALAALNLSDGRTLSELQQDPLYDAAVEQIAEKLRTIMEQFPTVTLEMQKYGTQLRPPVRDINARIDRNKILQIPRKLANGGIHVDDLRVFKEDETQAIASPGDLFLSIDASGSMGTGAQSPFAVALKSAALLRDAAERVNMGVFVSMWGNHVPSLLIHPDMEEDIAHDHLDAALHYVLEGDSIPGLHNGTDVGPSIAQMFARLGKERETLPDEALRGPAQSLVLSDGGLFGEDAKFDLSESLGAFPHLTYDCGLTQGENSILHTNLQAQAAHLADHQQPICFGIDDPDEIPHQLVSWAEERMHQMILGVSEGRAVRQGDFREQSEDALRIFCDAHAPDADKMLDSVEEDKDVTHIDTPSVNADRFEHVGTVSAASKTRGGAP